MAKINMGVWTQAERSQFEKGVVQFGWGNWLDITKGIPSRRKSQVKSHAQKFALHRPVEHAKLIDKHNKMEAMKKKKKKVDGGTVTPKAASTQLRKKKKTAAKRVMRASQRLVRTAATTAAKGMSKPALLKAENPSKGTPRKSVVAKEEPKLGAQPTTSKDDLFMETGSGPMKVDSSPTTDDDDISGLERPSSTKKDEGESKLRAQLSQMHIKVEDSEMRCGGISPLPTVTPTSSIKASADEAETLKFLFSNLDDLEGLENSHKGAPNDVEVKSFLDMNPEEQCDIFPGIIEDSSVNVAGQDNWCHALSQLRLQVQPNDAALFEVAAYLESPPDSPKYFYESKSALMRRRIIKLAMDASNVGWWRESEMMMPDIAKKAHLEHLVAMTFAVLQADAWKSSSEDSSFNAQDDIRHICQLIPGIWNRVNYSLARDSFELFETGTGHYLDRSNAVNRMVRMFDEIPNASMLVG
jgi:hypothetical protein